MLPIRSLDLVDSNITQTLTGWTYFLHFPVTGRVARAFSGVFYIGSNYGISFFVTFSDILRLRVTGGDNRSSMRKPPPNFKSLATFSHAPDGIPTRS